MARPDLAFLLHEASRGDREAHEQLYALVCHELRERAHLLISRERADHSFETTDLLHETWLRLVPETGQGSAGSSHFLRLAATAMRHVLVDHARRRTAAKRAGPGTRIALDLAVEGLARTGCDVIALHDALLQLRSVDETLTALVELRFFGGATLEECAGALGVSLPTAERKWRLARIWLRSHWEK